MVQQNGQNSKRKHEMSIAELILLIYTSKSCQLFCFVC